MVDPQKPEFQNLPHIGAANIEKETGQLLEYNTVQEDGLISGKYLFGADDVIYSKVRPYFAKAALPGFIGLCSADAYPLHPNSEKITPYFLLQSIIHPRFTKYTSSISKRTGMPKVNREDLSNYYFNIPSINEQLKINDILFSIDKRIRVQNKIIKHKKSLIISLIIEILLSVLSLVESFLSLNLFSMINNLLKLLWTIFKEVKRIWSKKKT